MEIKNIRQKIATPIEYKTKGNYWEIIKRIMIFFILFLKEKEMEKQY
jgi:hypothetical protein